MVKKQTKIVATISDLMCDVDHIKALYEAGVNVVRLNTAQSPFPRKAMRRVSGASASASEPRNISSSPKPTASGAPCWAPMISSG